MFYAHWWFWLYAACWAPYTAALVLYGARSPWWRSWAGRSLLALYAALVAVLSLVLVEQIWTLPHPWRVALAGITLGAVAVAGLVQLALIARLQTRDRNEARR